MEQQPKDARSIFRRALQIESASDLRSYLDVACAGDPELRREIESLLAARDPTDPVSSPKADPPLSATELTAAQGSAPAVAPTEQWPETDEVLSLGFLLPSDRPGSLGRLGHYDIRELLGRGGFGVVFKAFDEKLLRVVAVKVLGPRLVGSAVARKRFLREARSAAAVRNDHVVDIHAVEEQPIPYLVMEYVAGQTLQRKLDCGGPLGLREVLRIGMQIAEGLSAAHHQGLIHRDVKPANILLENGVERVKISDFGLARAADDYNLSQSGAIAGTPAYMAPEQARGETISHRADLFSLGTVLYVMCTGRSPFQASTTWAVLKRVCEEAPRPIREIKPDAPEWLCAIIARLHAKKPEERFASAREVADLLAGRLSELQMNSSSRSPGPPPPEPEAVAPISAISPPVRPRRRWPALTVLLVLLAVGLGLALTEATGLTRLTAGAASLFRPAPAGPTGNVAAGAEQAAPAVLPFDAVQARAYQEAWAKKVGAPVETTDSVGMKLRLIPPGEFFMTADYRVRISRPFRLGTYETTVGQFRAFVRGNGYRTDAEASGAGGWVMDVNQQSVQKPEYTWRHPDVARGDDYPVGQVSWQDAVAYCRWIGRKENATYRLPTEAEWEWACRAGSEAAYSFGDDPKELGDYARFGDNSGWKSHPVGLKKPNAWGLFDMHGNICEYCQDWYGDLPSGARTDPKGPPSGDFRVIRGYGFVDSADGLQSNQRAAYDPTGSMFHYGFRVVREVPE